MSKELEFLSRLAAAGRLDRRAFLGRAAALGIGATFANSLLASAVRAQGPQKGGDLRMGLTGGESTNSLDPATWLTQVPQNFGSTWGELLVLQSPEDGSPQPMLAESWEASADAPNGIQDPKGVTFHNGKELTPKTRRKRSAAIQMRTPNLPHWGCCGDRRYFSRWRSCGSLSSPTRTSAAAHRLPPGYPAERRLRRSCGLRSELKVEVNEPGVARFTKYDGYWNDDIGHVGSVEVIVMNDATARTSALQSGQVHIINRVEPRTVAPLERVPG